MTRTENTNVDAVDADPGHGFVFGIDVTEASLSDVARIVVRADEHGESLLVGHRGADDRVVSVAEITGATVVELADSSLDVPRDELVKAARAYGYRGLVWHSAPSEQIDFAGSIRDVERADQFVVEASVADDADDVDVLVAIPAYDEANTIEKVVREASRYADRLVVVDDGSDDDTARRAEKAGATVIRHDVNRGYGAAVKTAFEQAARLDTDHLVVLDADCQHDPADIPRLVETQRETGAEMVIGNRYLSDGGSDTPMYRRVGLSVINAMTNVGLGLFRPEAWIQDTQSGFRAYDANAVRTLADDATIGDRMSASTDIIYHAARRDYSIMEIGVNISYDVEDGNSLNPVSHGIVLVSNLLKLIEQERPITLIGVPGFVIALLGLSLGYWTFTVSLRTGSLPFDLAFGSIFFALTGVLACFSAIILHSIEVQIDR